MVFRVQHFRAINSVVDLNFNIQYKLMAKLEN